MHNARANTHMQTGTCSLIERLSMQFGYSVKNKKRKKDNSTKQNKRLIDTRGGTYSGKVLS